MARAAEEWDRFWRYDRLSSFETGPGAPNYSGDIADGWRDFFAGVRDGGAILDIATGNGAIAVLAIEAAAKSGRTFDVTGTDLADIAPSKFVTSNGDAIGRIRFQGRVAAEDLPFGDASFDAVTSQFGIEYSDLDRSLFEAARVLRSGGRIRLAMHAAEGVIVRDTRRSLEDADFLLDQAKLIALAAVSLSSLVAWEQGKVSKQQAQEDHGRFRSALELVERYEPRAIDRLMLASVRRDLIEAFNTHRDRSIEDQLAAIRDLETQVRDHRDRQRALIEAAVARDEVAGLAARLEAAGLVEVETGEQRREGALLAHILEGTAP